MSTNFNSITTTKIYQPFSERDCGDWEKYLKVHKVTNPLTYIEGRFLENMIKMQQQEPHLLNNLMKPDGINYKLKRVMVLMIF